MAQRVDVKAGRAIVARLNAEQDALIEAMVTDGWPEAMAREGLAMHMRSWEVEGAAEALRRELEAVGPGQHLMWPQRVSHIWPALPGAGVGPVLLGAMMGVPQGVKVSRRGQAFGKTVCELAGWEVLEGERWREAPVVVVSGSDETLREVRARVPGARVVGYGHRVSFAVMIDGPTIELRREAQKIAEDVVMWRQAGCFSVRAVIFVGQEERCRAFGERLAEVIAQVEVRLGADTPDEGAVSARAQALTLAQMTGAVFVRGVGYVRLAAEPFETGESSPQAVSLHRVDEVDDIARAVGVREGQVQGVALAGAWQERSGVVERVASLGATRVAPAGQMQQVPLRWWHDGQANLLSWVRVVECSEL
ncbi:acyl-CoA reductase [Lujinxingia sediminis]|nr:acyl-CoA reductase [Lujinxingia sediminis]